MPANKTVNQLAAPVTQTTTTAVPLAARQRAKL